MPYEIGQADNYLDLLQRFRRFICGHATWSAPALSGTGNGTMAVTDTAPTTGSETWTIKCTDATTPGAEVWSVSGSVSGAQTNATTGVAYTGGPVEFTITAGSTNFAVNDAFTFSTTEGAMTTAGQAWDQLTWDGGRELQIEGKGVGGNDQIFMGIQIVDNLTAPYYNWSLRAADGYLPANDYASQPNASNNTYMLCWNDVTPYWFIANGRRFIIVAKSNTAYHSLYGGLYLPYATPREWPYPVMISGSSPYSNHNYTSSDARDRSIVNPSQNACYVRYIDGTWSNFGNISYNYGNWIGGNNLWPGYSSVMRSLAMGEDGSMPLYPVILDMNDHGGNVCGELQGVFQVPGIGNVSENTVTIGGVTYVVFQSGLLVGPDCFWAVELS